jgi:hypothetical protein
LKLDGNGQVAIAAGLVKRRLAEPTNLWQVVVDSHYEQFLVNTLHVSTLSFFLSSIDGELVLHALAGPSIHVVDSSYKTNSCVQNFAMGAAVVGMYTAADSATTEQRVMNTFPVRQRE